jgi:hypothetical protein
MQPFVLSHVYSQIYMFKDICQAESYAYFQDFKVFWISISSFVFKYIFHLVPH